MNSLEVSKKQRKFSCIACYDDLLAVGYQNNLIYKIPEDMKIFREITLKYKNIVMGRKTFNSLPKVLDGRVHYVFTRDKELTSKNTQVKYIQSREDILHLDKAIVIGGPQIYKLFKDYYSKLYITHVDTFKKETEYDAVFPFEPYVEKFTPSYTKFLNSYNGNTVRFVVWER